jgi:hypothetical protein
MGSLSQPIASRRSQCCICSPLQLLCSSGNLQNHEIDSRLFRGKRSSRDQLRQSERDSQLYWILDCPQRPLVEPDRQCDHFLDLYASDEFTSDFDDGKLSPLLQMFWDVSFAPRDESFSYLRSMSSGDSKES